MRVDFSKEMLHSLGDICDQLLQVVNVVKNPPCEIATFVRFIDNVCPFSKERDCSRCISNEFDAECVNYLRSATKFGNT